MYPLVHRALDETREYAAGARAGSDDLLLAEASSFLVKGCLVMQGYLVIYAAYFLHIYSLRG